MEIGTRLDAIDTERGAKVSGSRFYFLTGVGAQLEIALVNLAMAQAAAAGFIPVIAPALVKPEVMEGTGFLGAHSAEVYHLATDDLYLVGTSEVALAGYHSDEILDTGSLPRRYAGFSSCFRREAGSYGKDTHGIIRVHWFDKVEMFSYTTAEAARDEHQQLLAWEREFLDKLELAYRVIDIAAGDLGSSAARKYDIEAWFPSQGTYRELTSTSNCTTFQARRLNIRTRTGSGTVPVATLNGTLCAISRTIACLLDHHQRPTARSTCPRRCALGSAAASASSRRDDPSARERPGRHAGAIGRERERPNPRRVAPGRRGGLLVAFVTGRPPRWLHEIADAVDHRGVAVAANGAVIYDLRTETVIREHPLSPELLAEITEEVRSAFPAVRFGVEYGLDFGYEPGYRHDWEMSPSHDRQGNPLPPPRMAELAEIIRKPAVKLLAKDLTADADEMMVATSRLLAGRATVTHSSRLALLEIAARGRDQGHRSGGGRGRLRRPSGRGGGDR